MSMESKASGSYSLFGFKSNRFSYSISRLEILKSDKG